MTRQAKHVTVTTSKRVIAYAFQSDARQSLIAFTGFVFTGFGAWVKMSNGWLETSVATIRKTAFQGFAVLLACGTLGQAHALDQGNAPPAPFFAAQDASLISLAVHIDRTPKQSWPGYGIYLGNGYVLTAAHVVGSSLFTRPQVEIAGKTLAAQVIREGSFDADDLTLLRVDDSALPFALRLRRVRLCPSEPPLGTSVIVVTPEGTTRSRLFHPNNISASILSRFPTLIPDVATTGNSGSGVFDARSLCLLGIMSRKISLIGHVQKGQIRSEETHDIAKYFVPSAVILQMIPPDVKF